MDKVLKKDHNKHKNKKDNINKQRNLKKKILIQDIGQQKNILLIFNFFNNMKI
jgi:hypothetical protein